MAGLLGTNKDIEKLARRARKRGWVVEVTARNHIRWTSPEGVTYTSGLTMSRGGVSATLRNLRKIGLS